MNRFGVWGMHRSAAIVVSCAVVACSGALIDARADDAPPAARYFFSMRAPDVDPAPRYVEAWSQSTDTLSAAIAACDGVTYYLAPDDLAVVNAALANQNSVELQTSPDGAAAESSAVVCLMQASP